MSDGNDAAIGVEGSSDGGGGSAIFTRADLHWVKAEVIRVLPQGFLAVYEDLVLRSSPSLRGASGASAEVGVASGKALRTRTSTGQTETRSGAHNRKRQGLSQRSVLGDERALVLRRRIDRKLRALAREIRGEDEGIRNELRRCTRCRTFAEGDWLYCPRDGAPTEQVD